MVSVSSRRSAELKTSQLGRSFAFSLQWRPTLAMKANDIKKGGKALGTQRSRSRRAQPAGVSRSTAEQRGSFQGATTLDKERQRGFQGRGNS